MTISKISSLRKSRVHGSYVDRANQVIHTSRIEAIDPIHKTKNSSFYSSENHLMSYDEYYDSLKELKKEYRRFYRDEQNLEHAIKDLNENKDKLIDNMEELITRYNEAIVSLMEFDRIFDTDNLSRIVAILKDYEMELNNLGIYITRDKELEMKRDIFIKRIEESTDALDFLFKPTQGMIVKLYSTFRSIKLPKKLSALNKFTNSELKGSILDNKM